VKPSMPWWTARRHSRKGLIDPAVRKAIPQWTARRKGLSSGALEVQARSPMLPGPGRYRGRAAAIGSIARRRPVRCRHRWDWLEGGRRMEPAGRNPIPCSVAAHHLWPVPRAPTLVYCVS